ncbi:MAG: YfhO family protein, partial [Lachnospiraceae bacterium]|nr:YfhO family protein [Lachnospiraceae bacterium]
IASWIVRDDNASGDDVSTDITTENGIKRVSASFKIGKETALYLMGPGKDTETANSKLLIERGGDEYGLYIPPIGDLENINYPAHFNNNAVYIGTYEDEDVKVSVTMEEDLGEYYDLDIIGVDLAAMESLCASYEEPLDDHIEVGKNTVAFDQTAGSDDEYMLLPMTYDKGWKVKDNNKRAKAKSYAGLFTLIPLKSGDNTVTMKFTPPGMRFGCFVSIVALLAGLIYLILAKVRKEKVAGPVQESLAKASMGLRKAYTIAFLVVLAFMYVLPIIVGVCVLIIG